jgi:hypothetical protein
MFYIILSNKVKENIILFIDSYKNTFIKTFSDTWIFYEDIIRENYIKNSRNFYIDILDWIDNFLQKENIYWYTPITKNKSSIFLKIHNYKLKLFYISDNIKKVRRVYKIEFHN